MKSVIGEEKPKVTIAFYRYMYMFVTCGSIILNIINSVHVHVINTNITMPIKTACATNGTAIFPAATIPNNVICT